MQNATQTSPEGSWLKSTLRSLCWPIPWLANAIATAVVAIAIYEGPQGLLDRMEAIKHHFVEHEAN